MYDATKYIIKAKCQDVGFAQDRGAWEGAHPPPVPTPVGRQGGPLLQLFLLFAPQNISPR